MKDEIDFLHKKQNMDSNDIAIGKKMLKCKWVYKINYEANEGIGKYKACLVVKVVFKFLELILMTLIPYWQSLS
jgi:hypothetical protein